jgi:hypothetical protein
MMSPLRSHNKTPKSKRAVSLRALMDLNNESARKKKTSRMGSEGLLEAFYDENDHILKKSDICGKSYSYSV